MISILTIHFFNYKLEKTSIAIGSKNCTENYIIAEIIAELIERETDLKVKRKLNLEGTFICFDALRSKDIDLYVEYTGTALVSILKEDIIKDRKKAFHYIKDSYEKKYNIIWLDPLGFNNSYVLLMNRKKAQKLNIKTFSDLQNHHLKFAFDPEFLIRKEFSDLKNKYQLECLDKIMLDQMLLYLSLKNNVVDIANGFATDSKIEKYDLLVLEDDKNIMPTYDAAIIIREDVLLKYPHLKKILDKLKNSISDEKIKKMNYEAEEKNKNIYTIAKEFIENIK